MNDAWAKEMRKRYSDIPILSIAELRSLPEAKELEGGIYFLWIGDDLQYIGKSKHIVERISLQDYANQFHTLRASKSPKPIPYDRHTCLVLGTGRIIDEGLAARLTAYERAYIAHYTPPMNHIGQNPGT